MNDSVDAICSDLVTAASQLENGCRTSYDFIQLRLRIQGEFKNRINSVVQAAVRNALVTFLMNEPRQVPAMEGMEDRRKDGTSK